jgi:hypothetical protein
MIYFHVLLSGGILNFNAHLSDGLNFIHEQMFSHVR